MVHLGWVAVLLLFIGSAGMYGIGKTIACDQERKKQKKKDK